MWEDRFGFDENIPEEIQDIFMWLCQDVFRLQRMWDFYIELFRNEEDLALYTDYASTSFKIIEEALRTSMVMAISRLNDPSTQYHKQNLSFQRLVEFCQDVHEINNLYEAFDKACKPFTAYRNKRFGHRDLPTTLEYSNNLLPGIGKKDVEEVLRLAKQLINSIAQHYTGTEYGFISPVIGGAESLKFFFKMGIDSYKNNLRKISNNNYYQKSNTDLNEVRTIMNDWLEIDNLRNAILSLEFSVEYLEKVQENNFNWKWVIIGIHNAFQSYMVLALRGSNPVNIMREKDAEEWLKAYEEKSKLPEYKLDTFLNLYKKIKSDRMMMYTNSKKFTPKDSEEKSVKRLNRLRNEFMHYKLGGWVIQIDGLPDITLDIMNIIGFLANDSENINWSDSTFKDQTNLLLSKGKMQISRINSLVGR